MSRGSAGICVLRPVPAFKQTNILKYPADKTRKTRLAKKAGITNHGEKSRSKKKEKAGHRADAHGARPRPCHKWQGRKATGGSQ